MGKKGGVNVRMENNDVKGSVIGADTVNVDSTRYGGNVDKGDKFSGQGSSKVGGNVTNLSMKNITVEPVPPTSDIGEDVAMIFAHHLEVDIRNVRASLHSLGVDSLQELGYVKETDLTNAGIKLVHARKLMDYYEKVTQSPSKANSNVGRKRTIPVGKEKYLKKARTTSVKKQGNPHYGDNISGPGVGWKVQGNVNQPNIGRVPGAQLDEKEQSEHEESDAESDLTSDSEEEEQSSQSRMENLHATDNISGTEAVKVEKNVQNASVNSPAVKNEEQRPTQSEMRSGSEHDQSTSSGTVETVPATCDIDFDLSAILTGVPKEDIQNVRAKLGNLGIYNLKDFEFVEESDITNEGIEEVQARKLFQHYADHFQSQESDTDMKDPLKLTSTKEEDCRIIGPLKKTIGKNGGKIEFTEYEHCYIKFPPGALDKDVEFKISLVIGGKNEDTDELILTPTLHCQPPITFKKSVTISLPTCYKPIKSEVEVVPQTFSNNKWEDEKPVLHGGKGFIIFTTKSFCRKRVVSMRGSNELYLEKIMKYLGYIRSHTQRKQFWLQWRFEDYQVGEKFDKTLNRDVFKGTYLLKNTAKQLSLELGYKSSDSITVRPPSHSLSVSFNKPFYEVPFHIVVEDEVIDRDQNSFYYCIEDDTDSGNCEKGGFPFRFIDIQSDTKGNHHYGNNINGLMAGWNAGRDVNQPKIYINGQIGNVPDEGGRLAQPETKSSSGHDQSTCSGTDLDVSAILTGVPSIEIQQVKDALLNLKIRQLNDFQGVDESALTKQGVKIVYARKFLKCYTNYHQSQESDSVINGTDDINQNGRIVGKKRVNTTGYQLRSMQSKKPKKKRK